MLDPTVKSALIVLIAFLLNLLFELIGLPVDEGTLYAIAAAIVALLFGDAIGLRVANRIRQAFARG